MAITTWIGFFGSFYLMREYSSSGVGGRFKSHNNGKYYNYQSYLILKDEIIPHLFEEKHEGQPNYF